MYDIEDERVCLQSMISVHALQHLITLRSQGQVACEEMQNRANVSLFLEVDTREMLHPISEWPVSLAARRHIYGSSMKRLAKSEDAKSGCLTRWQIFSTASLILC